MDKKYIKLIIALCGLAASSIGVYNNSISVFNNSIVEELNVYSGSVALYITIYSISVALFNIAVARILSDSNIKKITIIGMVVSSVSAIATSRFTALWQFYIMAVFRGFAVACYQGMIITNVINGWFKKNSGIINSGIMCLGGLGGVVLPLVFARCINAYGWRNTSIILGVVSFVLASPVLFTKLSLHPEAVGEVAYGANEYNEVSTSKSTNKNFSFFSSSFIIICIYALASSAGHGMINNMSGYGKSIGLVQVGVTALSFAMAANIISKLLAGYLFDKFNSLVANISCLVVSTIGAIGLMIFKTPTLIIISTFLFGFMYAPISIGYNFILKEFYDISYFKKALPIVSLFAIIGNASFTTIFGYLYDFTNTYYYMFVIMLVFTIINIGLLFIAKKRSAAGK